MMPPLLPILLVGVGLGIPAILMAGRATLERLVLVASGVSLALGIVGLVVS